MTNEAVLTTELEEANVAESEGLLGHPRGLGPLFFTELWERFSYYGMRSILILYMTAAAAQGGLGFTVRTRPRSTALTRCPST